MIKKVLVLTIAMMLAVGAFSQTLEETVKSMLSSNATMYSQPLGDGMGSLMNSGYYHRSRVHKMLGFDLSIKMMALSVADESKFFDFALADQTMSLDMSKLSADIGSINVSLEDVYKDANTRVPTIAASKDSVGVIAINDAHLASTIRTQIEAKLIAQGSTPVAAQATVGLMSGQIDSLVALIPDLEIPGAGLSIMALPMPQISLGLPMGIELTLRGVPEYDIPEVGLFSMYGGGVRVNVDQFIPIPLFPIDITAGAFYSQLSIGDLFESKNSSVNLQVGKSISLLFFGVGIYADAAYETSSVSMSYTPDPEDGLGEDPIGFELETEPGLRLGAGLHITAVPLTYLSIHVSQTPNNNVVTLGAGITLR